MKLFGHPERLEAYWEKGRGLVLPDGSSALASHLLEPFALQNVRVQIYRESYQPFRTLLGVVRHLGGDERKLGKYYVECDGGQNMFRGCSSEDDVHVTVETVNDESPTVTRVYDGKESTTNQHYEFVQPLYEILDRGKSSRLALYEGMAAYAEVARSGKCRVDVVDLSEFRITWLSEGMVPDMVVGSSEICDLHEQGRIVLALRRVV